MKEESITIVRVVTDCYKTKRGFAYKKSVNFLKRKCKGFNLLEEDIDMLSDASEAITRIVNFLNVDDGVYEVRVIEEFRDWESGHVYDWNYELVKIGL